MTSSRAHEIEAQHASVVIPERPVLSVVVPVFNEVGGLAEFHASLTSALEDAAGGAYEIVYCNDGSTDGTRTLIAGFRDADPRVKLITFSRNFGKEIATTAGINQARGEAILTLDADGQHPVELVPQFVEQWRRGAKVVIGLRTANQNEGWVKRTGSRLFYRLFNRVTGLRLEPGSSDYRLIDQSVQREFARMTERSRITRGLIDWLGYDRAYITFTANPRLHGTPGYTFSRLVKLALDSIISMTKTPLYVSAYIGAVMMPLSLLVAAVMVIDAVAGDPLGLNAKGSAYVVVLLLFLVGLLLVSQGIIGFYLSHMYTETQNRPLYIIDREKSAGVDVD